MYLSMLLGIFFWVSRAGRLWYVLCTFMLVLTCICSLSVDVCSYIVSSCVSFNYFSCLVIWAQSLIQIVCQWEKVNSKIHQQKTHAKLPSMHIANVVALSGHMVVGVTLWCLLTIPVYISSFSCYAVVPYEKVQGGIFLPRPLSNDPLFIQFIYCNSHASKRFVEV